jgi:endonuclease/exonuclease/phosphatase family metal-dependent hydrolase
MSEPISGDAPQVTSPDARSTAWRVMTWNIRGAGRPDIGRLAEIVLAFAPDVLALQEIRRRQAIDLATRLRWQHHWARKHSPYTPLVWWLAEGAAIMSPHALAEPARRSLSPGVSTWTFRHRIALAATVRRATDAIRLYDVHLAAHHQPDERIAQAERVAAMIGDEGAPRVVVAGDLNAPGEVEVIRPFHAIGLRDPGGGPTHPSIAPKVRLDHVLVPDRARVTYQHEPDGGDEWWALSDHVPVIVEFD